jgi:hypothetical protein
MANTKTTEPAAEQAADNATTAKPAKAAVKAAAKTAGAVVYCGPTVRHVAQQYTVYTGDVPKALADWLEEHKAAKSLLVPLARFTATRAALEEPGSVAAVLFNKIKAQAEAEAARKE